MTVVVVVVVAVEATVGGGSSSSSSSSSNNSHIISINKCRCHPEENFRYLILQLYWQCGANY